MKRGNKEEEEEKMRSTDMLNPQSGSEE